MISWLTTVAPQTSFSGSSEQSTIRNQNPGAGASITITQRGTTTSSYNWSQTQYSSIFSVTAHTGGGGESSVSYVSVLGTTNSTSGNNYTLRSVLNATSTTTTREYTYGKTGTQTSTTSQNTTTAYEGQTFAWTGQISATITTTTAVATTSETCVSTTTGAETIRTPICASVYVADKHEVLLVASSLAATAANGYSAASAVLTTATRTTLMPWTQTVAAVTANTGQTTSYAQPAISGSVSFNTVNVGSETRSTVADFGSLPNKTETTNWQTYALGTSATSFTALPAETITATGSALSLTSAVTSIVQTSGTTYGSSYVTTATTVATITRQKTFAWAESSTQTSRPTIGATSNIGTGTDTSAYTWTMTFDATTSNALTTFANQPQGCTVYLSTNQSQVSKERRFVSGVANGTAVAVGYTCQALGLIPQSPLKSRNVVSLTGGTIQYSSTYATTASNEEGTYGQTLASAAGMATVNGLSVTAKNSNTSATTSFVVSGFGNTTYHFANALNSKIDASLLGGWETLYATAIGGVYSSGTTTFSTTGGASSWSAGAGSQPALFPLSFFGAGTATTPDVVLWSTSRNSHASHSVLTNAGAYSQV